MSRKCKCKGSRTQNKNTGMPVGYELNFKTWNLSASIGLGQSLVHFYLLIQIIEAPSKVAESTLSFKPLPFVRERRALDIFPLMSVI